ncbi:aspartyl-tRNA(Asn)/glutamyl-tRNA(Gln) amidotransferase subunit A [Palleronia salina]|uniref:Aspartyl-tRNA(Asn)/glutamyl-tRNA(Gln) amidotransferase subunit A n=1 Tax=Palleronia salina TaxID=313368 RepID=A0A1M6DK03_9RHOB|nr:amidase family protein [Palleronia salina]SHI73328.1 aspartyl-tRNA(Asn)/glutamyl-tRNA(Gln) amidotransferase subunit A [Palleronia salina]
MDDLTRATACDLGRAIGQGALDPVELAQTFLDAASDHDLAPRIFARMTPDRALSEAQAARQRARHGVRRGLLDGVPIGWKDLYDCAGVPCEGGSALLEGRVPDRDAALLRQATLAGLVCLGKTHLSELAFSGLGLNPSTATPPCVNDPDAVSGGSSSGAAASVAFGLAPAGIGSDTGGSIRLPAAWNDLVGFKPGHGSLSMEGALPLCPSFDTAGPLARSVEDAAEIWAVLAGRRAPDLAYSSLAGRRLMVLENALADCDETVVEGFERAVALLERAGAVVERRALPCVDTALAQSPLVFAPEGYAIWRETIESAPDRMYHQVRTRFRAGADVSACDFVAAWRTLDRMRAEYAAATAGYDAVIQPTCPILPPKRARLETDDDYYVSANLMTLRNTRIGNLLGLAGLSLPSGTPSVGLLLQGLAGHEGRLLRLGQAAERALA